MIEFLLQVVLCVNVQVFLVKHNFTKNLILTHLTSEIFIHKYIISSNPPHSRKCFVDFSHIFWTKFSNYKSLRGGGDIPKFLSWAEYQISASSMWNWVGEFIEGIYQFLNIQSCNSLLTHTFVIANDNHE